MVAPYLSPGSRPPRCALWLPVMFFFAAMNVTPEINDMLAAIDLKRVADESSPLVAIYADPTSHPIARLRMIQVEMLRCYQALEEMRLRPDEYTVQDARAVSRRFRHLKGLAALEVRQARHDGAPGPGAEHPMAAKLMAVTLDKVVEVLHESLSAEHASAVEKGLRKGLAEDDRIPWPPPGATP